jgi:mannitol/fructose-specific phosphotransferase system IIA component (Ntr-type)
MTKGFAVQLAKRSADLNAAVRFNLAIPHFDTVDGAPSPLMVIATLSSFSASK